jgi:hypothetical protein
VSSSGLASLALLQDCQCLKFRPIKMNSSKKFGSEFGREETPKHLENIVLASQNDQMCLETI